MNIIEFEAKDVERHSVCAAICAMDEADEKVLGKTKAYSDNRRAVQNRMNRHNSIKDKLKEKRQNNRR